MDLKAFENTYDEKLSNYIEKNYGEIPRCRGYELMRSVITNSIGIYEKCIYGGK